MQQTPFSNSEYSETINYVSKYNKIKLDDGNQIRRSTKKQRQKEFKEKKEHQERLKAIKKANRDTRKSDDEPDEMHKTKV